jgi:hypothetical protein
VLWERCGGLERIWALALADDWQGCRSVFEHRGAQRRLTLEQRCVLRFAPAERAIYAQPWGAAAGRGLADAVLNQGFPQLWTAMGRLALHAGSVCLHGQGLLVAGQSGSGKSTLMTYLTRHGARLLGDDVAFLTVTDGHPHALPAYPAVRLWADSAAELLGREASDPGRKHGFAAQPHGLATCDAPVPVAAVVVLQEPEQALPVGVQLRSLRGGAAFAALNRHLFRFAFCDPEPLRKALEQTVALATRVPVCTLQYHRSYEALGPVLRALTGLCAHGSAVAA